MPGSQRRPPPPKRSARAPHDFYAARTEKLRRYLKEWQLTTKDVDEGLNLSPSLRGMFLGYVSEQKLREKYFAKKRRVTALLRPDDHDRTRKYDLEATFKKVRIRIEVKSLQSSTVKVTKAGAQGQYQLDGSDQREVTLKNGKSIRTTSARVSDFDVVAVSLFKFGSGWRFAFALSTKLQQNNNRKYSAHVRRQLLKGMQAITLPLKTPYVSDPYVVFERVVARARAAERARLKSKRSRASRVRAARRGARAASLRARRRA